MLILRHPEGDPGGGQASNGPGDGGQEEQKYDVVVDGEMKKFTLGDLTTAASKVGGADKRFEEASVLQKAAEVKVQEAAKSTALLTDLQAINTSNDPDAFRRVGKQLGWDDTKIESVIQAQRTAEIRRAVGVEGSGQPAGETEEGDGEGINQLEFEAQVVEKVLKVLGDRGSTNKVTWENLDPRMQEILGRVVNDAWKGKTDRQVDTDQFLVSLRKDGSPQQVAALEKAIESEAQRRAQQGHDITDPKVIKEVLQEVKTDLEAWGVRPAKAKVSRVSPGLGAAGTGGDGSTQSGEPIKRPDGGLVSGGQDMGQYVTDMLNRALDAD